MPVYAAWNRDKAESEKLPFPPWSLGIAVALALGSLMPLVVVGILRALKVRSWSCALQPSNKYLFFFLLTSFTCFRWT